IDTLSPTYKLLLGVPGKSNAFEISKKLGLNVSIIEKAKKLLSKKDVDFEELLKNIYDNKSAIEKEKLQVDEELKKVSNLRLKLENDFSNSEEKSKQILQDAKTEARNILLQAKEDANNIIKEM